MLAAARAAAPAPVAVAAAPAPPARAAGADWEPDIGESEIADYAISRAVWSAFQFRGVLGTHTHAHQGGTVLPVFQFYDPAFEQNLDHPEYRHGRDSWARPRASGGPGRGVPFPAPRPTTSAGR